MHLRAALFVLPVLSLRAQTADLSGHWEGSIQLPASEVAIVADLFKNSAGELAGSFSQPGQNLTGLPLANVTVKDKSVRFQIKGAPGQRVFDGSLSADGKSLAGDFSQNGSTMPFSLTRTGDARIETPARIAPIGRELEGTWNGALEAGGGQSRLVLTLSNQPDGTASGNIFNIDDGLEIPVSGITQKASSVTLVVKAIGGSYSGALNAERTELAGTYTQGSLVVPVTFRRATEGKK